MAFITGHSWDWESAADASLFGAADAARFRVIRNEPVLWRRIGSGETQGRLLFQPRRILRVRGANRRTEYPPGAVRFDESRRLFTNLPVPAFAEEELFPAVSGPRTIERHRDGCRFIHFSEGHYFHDQQTSVDYETEERWNGPVPLPQPDRLPRLAEFLAGGLGLTLKLAVLGDSISTGANASGRYGVAPDQPGYAGLLADGLRRIAHGKRNVEVHNFSVGGKNAAWGLSRAGEVAESKPDLLLVAFGMNDASEAVPTEDFAASIGSILRCVSAASLPTEFVLVSGMSPNEAWHLANPELRETHHQALVSIARRSENKNVAFADVRSVWDFVVKRKGFWSLTGNGVNHPNDFGHRIYAECLLTAIRPHPVDSGNKFPALP